MTDLEVPGEINVTRAVMIGVVAAVATILVIEGLQLLLSRYTAREARALQPDATEFLGVHDATRGFLDAQLDYLQRRAGENGS